jgi:DNA-binding NarL/FixJ family response regulator
MKILIVDDQELVLLSLKKCLNDYIKPGNKKPQQYSK